jgi:hypothetical protein
LELPWAVRLVSLLIQVGLLAAILVWLVLLPFLKQPDDDELALRVERAKPEFGHRLIAAVQLARPGGLEPGASRPLAEATVRQAEAMSEPMDFRDVVSVTRVRRLGGLAAAVFVLGMIALLVDAPVSFQLLRRAFLSTAAVPRKTRVVIEDGDKVIGRGDDVRLEAVAQGVLPTRGKLELQLPGRRTQQFEMEPTAQERRRFVRILENVQESFDYVVYLNDGRSDAHTVQVRPRPLVRGLEAKQEFPPYTKLPAAARPLADLSLLAGSRLQLTITASQPIQTAALRFVGSNAPSNLSLEVGATDATRLQGEFVVPRSGLTGFAVQLVDTQGMTSREEVVYRIRILPDQSPEVRLTYPDRKEELVTRGARLLVGMEAIDDFAIVALRLNYRTEQEATAQVRRVELDLAGEHPARVERRFTWDLGTVTPGFAEGTVIEYWIEAEDNNDVTGPGVGQSAHQVARVVSESEKRADLLNRAGDIFSGIADATEEQEELNRRLGEIILEKTGP